MKTINEGNKISAEIVELLKDATSEQKLVIKGILMGAKEIERKVTSDKEAG